MYSFGPVPLHPLEADEGWKAFWCLAIDMLSEVLFLQFSTIKSRLLAVDQDDHTELR
jgi:hypothetical protein